MQCAVTSEPGDAFLTSAITLLGSRTVAFATDYPHADSCIRGAATHPALDELPTDVRASYLGGTAASLLGLAAGEDRTDR